MPLAPVKIQIKAFLVKIEFLPLGLEKKEMTYTQL